MERAWTFILHVSEAWPMSLQLLTGVGIDDANETPPISDRIHIDKADMKLLEDYHGMQDSQRKR